MKDSNMRVTVLCCPVSVLVPSSLRHSTAVSCCWTPILAPECVRAVCSNPFRACFGTQTTFQHRQAPAVPAGAGLGEQYCMHGWQDARCFVVGNCIFPFCWLVLYETFFFTWLFQSRLHFSFCFSQKIDRILWLTLPMQCCFAFYEEVSENTPVQGKVAWAARLGTDGDAIDDDRALATT